jgi:hypothetical protein
MEIIQTNLLASSPTPWPLRKNNSSSTTVLLMLSKIPKEREIQMLYVQIIVIMKDHLGKYSSGIPQTLHQARILETNR